MKYQELRDKELATLQHDLADRRDHLFKLRTQAVTEKLEDPSQLRKARRDIARILTAMRQVELSKPAEAKAAAAT